MPFDPSQPAESSLQQSAITRIQPFRLVGLLSWLLVGVFSSPLVWGSGWVPLGTGCGGQLLMISGDPADAATVYLGSDVAGLWRSEDQGATWQYLTSGWTPKDCQSLAFDPADTDHLFIAASDGIYHSLDRGQSWGRLVVAAQPGGLAVARAGGHLVVYFGTGRSRENTGGDGLFYRYNHGGSGVLESFTYSATTGALVSTLVNPANADDLWISSGAGVFRSLDGGQMWTAHNTGLPSVTCGKLLADPAQFDRLLVAVRGLGGTTGGVAYKPAGTTTWTSLSGNLPVTNVDWTAVATDPAAFGQRVWAGSSQDASGGLFYTANGLDAVPTWTARQTVTEAGWATANPIRTNPHTLIRLADGSLWTGKNGNFHQSTDEGLNWRQRYTTKVQTVAAITPAANQGRRRADNWINRGMVNTVDNMVAVDPANPLRILVAMADRGVFASADGGASFHQYSFRFDTLQAFSAFMVAFDPVQPNVAFAGLKDALASSEGQKVTGLFKGVFQPATQDWHWSLLAGGDGSLGGLPKEALPSALVFSHDGAVMWLVARGFNSSTSASLGVWESRDSGVTWQQIGLSTRNVESIAAHPSNSDILLVGVRNGRGGQGMWRGSRSGSAWAFTSTKALTAPKACYSVAFDQSQSSVAYATVGTSGADPEEEMGLYKSTDGALSWVRQVAFASGYSGSGVQSVAVGSSGICFASKAGDFDLPATLRRSSDGGATWSTQNPPFAEAGFLLTTAGSTPHLYASTAGMGLWRAPLSALTPAIEGWRQQYFGSTSNSGDAADGFDFDKDGLVNLLEWACGLDPTLSDSLKTAVILFEGNVVFNYSRSVSAVNAGAVFSVEWSDTLAANDWSTTGVSQTEFTNNGTLQQMKATLPAGSLGRRFVRLRVTAPPP